MKPQSPSGAPGAPAPDALIEVIALPPEQATEGEVRIRVGELRTVITLRPAVDKRGHACVEQSHRIKTPSLFRAFAPEPVTGQTAEDAVAQAVTAFARYYRLGVRDGHAPSESWLVPAETSPARPGSSPA